MDAPTPLPPVAAGDALPAFTHQQIVRVVTGIMLCILLAAIDQTVVVPAVPAIAADLRGFDHLSWIVSAYLLTSTAMMPIYGKLSDIYGRRAILLPAIVLFVIASVLCALSQTLLQLIIFRALQGIGGGGLMSMAQAAIADVVAPRERGRYQGYMAGTWGVASICGPVLGGWMTDQLSWHSIFWINLPFGAAAYVLSSRALKLLPIRSRRARIDYPGAALLTALITVCLLIMSWGGVTYAWGSAPILGMAALALVLLVGLALQERRALEPMLPPRLFANSVFNSGVLIAALAAAAMFGATFLLPLFFQLIRGADASTSGTLIAPFLGFNALGAYVSGRMSRWLGRSKAIVLCGLAVACAGFAVMAATAVGSPTALVLVQIAVVGMGIGVCMPASMMITQNAVERRDLGAATAALLFLRSMGSAFGSTIVGAILANRFAEGLARAGVTVKIDLTALRGGEGMARQFDPAVRAVARTALAGGFQMAFWLCAILMALAFLVCTRMRDLPLQSSGR